MNVLIGNSWSLKSNVNFPSLFVQIPSMELEDFPLYFWNMNGSFNLQLCWQCSLVFFFHSILLPSLISQMYSNLFNHNTTKFICKLNG